MTEVKPQKGFEDYTDLQVLDSVLVLMFDGRRETVEEFVHKYSCVEEALYRIKVAYEEDGEPCTATWALLFKDDDDA